MSTPTTPLHDLEHALDQVQDPDFNRSLAELGMIESARFRDQIAQVTLRLATPAHPLKDVYRSRVTQALERVAGVKAVEVTFTADTAQALGGRGPVNSGIDGVSHVIAVSSGKGGVGKSTTAVNLACALTLEGARVGLLDADIYGPNIPTMMGMSGMSGMSGQAAAFPEIVRNEKGEERFIPPIRHGIKVMSMGMLVEPDQAMIWRGPQLHSAVKQFCQQVDWGPLDYLVVDLPPGTGDVQLSLAQLIKVTGAVLVTTPQEVSTQDVRKAFSMFKQVEVPIIGLVENMSYFAPYESGAEREIEALRGRKYYLFGQGGGKKLADQLQIPLLAEMPIVPRIQTGGDTGRPMTLTEPNSEVSRAYRTFAGKVAHAIVGLANAPYARDQIIASESIGKF